MRKSLIILLLFSSFGLFSCEKKEIATEVTPIELSIDVVDSLDLEILGNPLMTSVNKEGSLVSFFDFPSSETIITNSNGEILGQFSKKEDTPDAYGFKLELPVVWGKDKVILIGMKGIFIYDLSGNMIKKIDHAEAMSSTWTYSRDYFTWRKRLSIDKVLSWA